MPGLAGLNRRLSALAHAQLDKWWMLCFPSGPGSSSNPSAAATRTSPYFRSASRTSNEEHVGPRRIVRGRRPRGTELQMQLGVRLRVRTQHVHRIHRGGQCAVIRIAHRRVWTVQRHRTAGPGIPPARHTEGNGRKEGPKASTCTGCGDPFAYHTHYTRRRPFWSRSGRTPVVVPVMPPVTPRP